MKQISEGRPRLPRSRRSSYSPDTLAAAYASQVEPEQGGSEVGTVDGMREMNPVLVWVLWTRSRQPAQASAARNGGYHLHDGESRPVSNDPVAVSPQEHFFIVAVRDRSPALRPTSP